MAEEAFLLLMAAYYYGLPKETRDALSKLPPPTPFKVENKCLCNENCHAKEEKNV